MNSARIIVAAGVALWGILFYGAAGAQTPTPTPKTAPVVQGSDSSKPSAAAEVEKWTTKQWDAAKAEWAKDKKKWAACRKQSKDQGLEGRKSWSFLYKCMTN